MGWSRINSDNTLIEAGETINWLKIPKKSYFRSNEFGSYKRFNWTSNWTKTILKAQFIGLAFLTWLLITLEGVGLPIKTNLNVELVPLWSLWIGILFTLNLSVATSFHFYPSIFGIIIAVFLQLITFIASLFFERIILISLNENSIGDNENITRITGGFIYSSIASANCIILISAIFLMHSGTKDICKCSPSSSTREVKCRSVAVQMS